jgi:hypothetical protein
VLFLLKVAYVFSPLSFITTFKLGGQMFFDMLKTLEVGQTMYYSRNQHLVEVSRNKKGWYDCLYSFDGNLDTLVTTKAPENFIEKVILTPAIR